MFFQRDKMHLVKSALFCFLSTGEKKFTAIIRDPRELLKKNSQGCVQSGPEWENKSTGAHLINALWEPT
jgi:hypothetical protein